jgi:hypothetical protein
MIEAAEILPWAMIGIVAIVGALFRTQTLLRKDMTEFQLEVAKNYASIEALAALERRLVVTLQELKAEVTKTQASTENLAIIERRLLTLLEEMKKE